MSNLHFKTVKVKLTDILRSNVKYDSLFKSITKVNEIVKETSLFMKAFIIHSIDNQSNLNHIGVKIIRMATYVICSGNDTKKRGKPFNDKTGILQELSDFFTQYTYHTGISKLDSTGLSYMLNDIYSSIYDEITNNIMYNFDKQIWAFIKASFPKPNSVKSKHHIAKLDNIKQHLYGYTTKNDYKLDYWVYYHRKLLLPPGFIADKFELSVKTNNFEYIKCMHFINKFLQSKALKSYQIYPLRTKSYNNYVKINTSALIEIFHNSLPTIFPNNVLDYYDKAGDTNFQEEIWNKVFWLKRRNGIYKYKFLNHSFNYEISTNGYAVSLNFIQNNDIIKKNNKKVAFRKGRKEANDRKKLDPEKAAELVKEKQYAQLEKEIQAKKARNESAKQKRAEFKKLPKERQEEIKAQLKSKEEFPYIEFLIKNNFMKDKIYDAFINGKLVYVDPGKRSILYMMGTNCEKSKNLRLNNFGVSIENNRKYKKKKNEDPNHKSDTNWKFLNYTSKTRRHFLKTDLYNKKREKWKLTGKKKMYKNLLTLEKELSDYNSKACDLVEFYGYIKKRAEYMNLIKSNYDATFLQKLRWYEYLNKLHHENELLNHIANEFGNDIIIIIGDWSNKGRLHFMPTPNLSLKRKLATRFTVYSIDEFRTSKLHNVHEVECKKFKSQSDYEKLKSKFSEYKDGPEKNNMFNTLERYKPKLNIQKKIYAVLTYKIDITNISNTEMACKSEVHNDENNSNMKQKFLGGCINRDRNSVLNMYKIVKSLLQTGERPAMYCR